VTLPALIPGEDEQRAIATFLDRETARIDALIARKQRLIELLAEKSAALISQAVTKGLNPEAPMKDSGVEWLGEIPAHWEPKFLKYAAYVKTGFAFSSEDFTDEGIPVLRIGDIMQDGRIDLTNAKYLPSEFLASNSDVSVLNGDIIMAMTGATIGKVGRYHSEKPALLNQRVCIFRARSGTDQDYLWFLLNSEFYVEHVVLTAFGGAQPNISDSELLACLVPVPPMDEQFTIAAFLARETAELDAMTVRVEAAIEKLKEYRAALIADAVTGKIDVRSFAKEQEVA